MSSDHRDKAVEAALKAAEELIPVEGRVQQFKLRRSLETILQTAEPHLKRMWLEEFGNLAESFREKGVAVPEDPERNAHAQAWNEAADALDNAMEADRG